MASLMKPKSFLRSSEGAVANYNYTDVANGSGYIVFTCGSTSNAGTLAYTLDEEAREVGNTDPTTVDAHERRFLAEIVASTTWAEVTFSTSPFNLPRTINGTAYFVFTLASPHNNTAAETQAPNVNLKINSTSIGNVSGSSVKIPASGVKTYCLSLSITDKVIQKGDVLKLTFTMVSGGTSAAQRIAVLHDPLNRDVSAYTCFSTWNIPAVTASNNPSKFLAYIPFKIDV